MNDRLPGLSEVAGRYADRIIVAIQREYPNATHHVMRGPEDCLTPRAIHPAFYGCFDWHSAVHMHWSLLRLVRQVPDALDGGAARAALAAHFTPEALVQERAYFDVRPTFERPYGWAWLLVLAEELADWGEDEQARAWSQAIAPLAGRVSTLMEGWLRDMRYPVRAGTHTNSAFALARALPWARRLAADGDSGLLDALQQAAMRWFGADHDYPAAWEPDGHDFLSAALTECELMGELLPRDPFTAWLDGFLPALGHGEPESLFTPVSVGDESDGQVAHLHGLNLYRAFAFARLCRRLPASDSRLPPLRAAIQRHARASLSAATGSHYMVEHWLATYAVMLLTEAEAL